MSPAYALKPVKLLVIAQHFPPVGGAGVQRITKFVKYLPEFGFSPVVITGSGEALGRWLPGDASLSHNLPEDLKIYRTSSNGSWPANPQRLTEIEEVGTKALEESGADMIFVTMSPFYDAGPAGRLAAKFKIPWVADLRDPWALDEFFTYRHRWEREKERRLMEASLRSAALIIMNTPEAAHRCREAFPSLKHVPIISITNGFDASDFRSDALEASKGRNINPKFTIVHSGAFHTDGGLRQRQRRLLWRLMGKLEPGVELLPRSPFYLLQALARWVHEVPELKNNLQVVFAGVPAQVDRDLVQRAGLADFVHFTGYLAHREAVDLVQSADLLFLPMHKVALNRRATIVPGKLYEFLASRRPVLAAVPPGDARDFLLAAGVATVTGPDDVEGMQQALHSHYLKWKANECTTHPLNPAYDVNRFERRQLTCTLAEELRRIHLLDREKSSQGALVQL